MVEEAELSIAQETIKRMLTELEQVRDEHATVIKTCHESCADRVDAAQARAEQAENRVGVVAASWQAKVDTLREEHKRELHAQGKTIARMKGHIRELEEENHQLQEQGSPLGMASVQHVHNDPPTEDDLSVEPVPGEIEPEETE